MIGKCVPGRVAFAAAMLCSILSPAHTRAGQVEVINRMAVACTLEAPGVSVAIEPNSSTSAFIDDQAGTQLKAVCKGGKLDKEETECKQVIGGSGPGRGADAKDTGYAFRYVKQVHVFPNMGRWLVCSSM